MAIKKWWKKLKDWQKGAILGGIFGLIFIVVALVSDPPRYECLLEFLGLMFILYIIPLVLLGAIIGLISSLIKNKFVFIGGIIGLIIGVFSVLLFETRFGKFFLYFLSNMLRIFFPLDNLGSGAEALAPFFILFNIFLWLVIGIIIGWITSLIKKRFSI